MYTQRAIKIILISRGQDAYNPTFSGRNLTLLGALKKGALFKVLWRYTVLAELTGGKSDRRAVYDALMKKKLFFM